MIFGTSKRPTPYRPSFSGESVEEKSRYNETIARHGGQSRNGAFARPAPDLIRGLLRRDQRPRLEVCNGSGAEGGAT